MVTTCRKSSLRVNYTYLPVIDPSIPAGEVGNFPQQFHHSTPTPPLKQVSINSFLNVADFGNFEEKAEYFQNITWSL